ESKCKATRSAKERSKLPTCPCSSLTGGAGGVTSWAVIFTLRSSVEFEKDSESAARLSDLSGGCHSNVVTVDVGVPAGALLTTVLRFGIWLIPVELRIWDRRMSPRNLALSSRKSLGMMFRARMFSGLPPTAPNCFEIDVRL